MDNPIDVVQMVAIAAAAFSIGCEFIMTQKLIALKSLRQVSRSERNQVVMMNLIFAPYWLLKRTMYQPSVGSRSRANSRTRARRRDGHR